MLNPEDDIENIYRDFAKNYPLKTEDSGWDEFLQKMESAPVKGEPASKPGTGNPFYGTIKKYSYWLTAAAVVVIVTGVLLFKNKNYNNGPPAAQPVPINNAAITPAAKQLAPATTADKHTRVVGKPKQEQATAGAGQPVAAQPQQLPADGIAKNPVLPNKQNMPLTQAKKSAETTSNKIQNSPPQNEHAITTRLAQQGKKAEKNIKQGDKQDTGAFNQLKNGIPVNQNTIAKNGDNITLSGAASNNSNGQKAINESNVQGDKHQDLPWQIGIVDSLKNISNKTNTLVSNGTKVQTGMVPGTNIDAREAQTPVLADSLQTVTGLNTKLGKDGSTQTAAVSPKKQTDKAATVQPMVKIKTSGNKYFYLGLVTGPDLSTVKFQEVKNTGYTAGLVIGMQLSDNISIESGLLYTAKKYYSSAVYFKSNGLPPPDRDDLQSVNANGKFFEVPITVKYNFINKKRYNVFLNGGFSSYFTSDEKYDLLFRRPLGNEVRRDDDDDVCANIFSIIHLSAGYEFKLNGNNTLRFEPYIKIPLSGLGAGSLPVTSGGLYINFTHSFFK